MLSVVGETVSRFDLEDTGLEGALFKGGLLPRRPKDDSLGWLADLEPDQERALRNILGCAIARGTMRTPVARHHATAEPQLEALPALSRDLQSEADGGDLPDLFARRNHTSIRAMCLRFIREIPPPAVSTVARALPDKGLLPSPECPDGTCVPVFKQIFGRAKCT